jgi:hypothetical protein
MSRMDYVTMQCILTRFWVPWCSQDLAALKEVASLLGKEIEVSHCCVRNLGVA